MSLANWPMRGISRDYTATSSPTVSRTSYAEINAVHPFRDGNGRAQRAFLRQSLALAADHRLAWEKLDAASLVYASQRSFQGDNRPMRDLIDLVLDPPDR